MTAPGQILNMGGHTPPDPTPIFNSQMTAAQANLEKAMMTVRDTLEYSLAETGKRGHFDYKSENPRLTRPGLGALGVHTRGLQDQAQWEVAFDALIKGLPEEVANEVLNGNPAFADLRTALELSAKVETQLARVLNAVQREYVQASIKANTALTDQAKAVLLTTGHEALQEVRLVLEELGRNHPEFDQLLGTFNQLQELLKEF